MDFGHQFICICSDYGKRVEACVRLGIGPSIPDAAESEERPGFEGNIVREDDSTRLYEKVKWKKISQWAKQIRNRP